MPRPRSTMRQIREVLRLAFEERLSRRQIGAAVGLPYTTVWHYLERARQAGLSWPLPEQADDRELEGWLFVTAAAPTVSGRPLPDWSHIHLELRRPGVTLMLLWLEYKERFPDGYQYSQFCDIYRRWQRHLDVVMRQEHRAGEKLFVDFPGQTISVYDQESGVVRFEAELFVAVLGASNYMYAEAFPSQELPYWISGHVHCFEFLGGCPQIVVCDYVDRHIIDVLCPPRLCGRGGPGSLCRSWRSRGRGELGHITIRVTRAISGAIRRTSRLAWSGTPPKNPEGPRPSRLPAWPWC